MADKKYVPKVKDDVIVIHNGVPVKTTIVKIDECTSLNEAREVCVRTKVFVELEPHTPFLGAIYKDKAEMLSALGDKI